MREILFRGKRIDNGEWVMAGNLIHFNPEGGELHYYIPKIKAKCVCTHDGSGNILAIEEGTFYKVVPETVGQFTGLTDKNGKRIFEGDIIKIPDDYNEFGHNAGESYEVYFAYGGFRLKPKYSKARGYWLEDDNTVEVIGNIHDNPELIGERKDNENRKLED